LGSRADNEKGKINICGDSIYFSWNCDRRFIDFSGQVQRDIFHISFLQPQSMIRGEQIARQNNYRLTVNFKY